MNWSIYIDIDQYHQVIAWYVLQPYRPGLVHTTTWGLSEAWTYVLFLDQAGQFRRTRIMTRNTDAFRVILCRTCLLTTITMWRQILTLGLIRRARHPEPAGSGMHSSCSTGTGEEGKRFWSTTLQFKINGLYCPPHQSRMVRFKEL